jgi:hypothetical protein
MEPEGSLPHSQQRPRVPILSHGNAAHACLSQVLKIHIYIIFPSILRSFKWSLSPRFLH